ncbi:MAG: four-helix bundle copper-binding protein [Phycisphaeraceae bacterium]|nr:MAG: four-helix bundle copper-binding protein [Phycisphaeraceae bacterium]
MSAQSACAETCHQCMDACLALIPHCLAHCVKTGQPADPEHIGTLMDCAEICAATHSFLHRGSPHHAAVCMACVSVCDACGACCAELGLEDAPTKACAAACKACADSCRTMAKH